MPPVSTDRASRSGGTTDPAVAEDVRADRRAPPQLRNRPSLLDLRRPTPATFFVISHVIAFLIASNGHGPHTPSADPHRSAKDVEVPDPEAEAAAIVALLAKGLAPIAWWTGRDTTQMPSSPRRRVRPY